MTLEKFLVLFIVAPCVFCGDDASMSQEITMSTFESKYDSGLTKNLINYDTESANNIANFASDSSESMESLTKITNYEPNVATVSEFTTEFLTTNSQLDIDDSSSPSTIDKTTRSKLLFTTTNTVIPDVTLTDNTICNPTWLVNASGKAKKLLIKELNISEIREFFIKYNIN